MMLYDRTWFHNDLFAVTLGGGFMNNPAATWPDAAHYGATAAPVRHTSLRRLDKNSINGTRSLISSTCRRLDYLVDRGDVSAFERALLVRIRRRDASRRQYGLAGSCVGGGSNANTVSATSATGFRIFALAKSSGAPESWSSSRRG